jgi:GMP synthase (glutamine-hydrolysing)
LVAPAQTVLLPVLIVLHQETSTPGRVGNALRALGHPLDIRRRDSAMPCRRRSIGTPAR